MLAEKAWLKGHKVAGHTASAVRKQQWRSVLSCLSAFHGVSDPSP